MLPQDIYAAAPTMTTIGSTQSGHERKVTLKSRSTGKTLYEATFNVPITKEAEPTFTRSIVHTADYAEEDLKAWAFEAAL